MPLLAQQSTIPATKALLAKVKPASTNPQANVPQPQEDPMDSVFQRLQDSIGNLQKAQENQTKEKTLLAVKSALISNPAIQKIMQMQNKGSQQAIEQDVSIEGSADVNPLAQGGSKLADLASVIGSVAAAGNAIQTRQTGINTILENIRAQEKQDIEAANNLVTANRGLLSDVINMSQERRARELQPLTVAEKQAELYKTQVEINKLQKEMEQGTVMLSPTELLSYAKALGVNPTQEEVQKAIMSGKTPQTAGQLEKNQALSQAKGYVSEIERLSGLVNTEPSNIKQIKAKGSGWINGTDTNIAELGALQATLTSIARALGEKGVISDSDIKRFGRSIPDWNDSSVKASAKISGLKSILDIATKTPAGTFSNMYTKDNPVVITDEEAADAIIE